MKNVILFTKVKSIQDYWKFSLQSYYTCLLATNDKMLQDYVTKDTSPIILLADVTDMQDVEGFVLKYSSYGNVDILLFHTEPTLQRVIPLLRTNIKGYENAYINKNNLLNMLYTVEQGNKWFSSDVTTYLITQLAKIEVKKEANFVALLTPTEKEIAVLITKGYTNKEIMQAKKIALSTVKGHIQKIFEKAGVSDRVSFVIKFKSF